MSTNPKPSSRNKSSQEVINQDASPSMQVLVPADVGHESAQSRRHISMGNRSWSSLSLVPSHHDSSLNQHLATPVRHVSLTAVQRKQDSRDHPTEPVLDWREFIRTNSGLKFDGQLRSRSFHLERNKDAGASDSKTESREATKSGHLCTAAEIYQLSLVHHQFTMEEILLDCEHSPYSVEASEADFVSQQNTASVSNEGRVKEKLKTEKDEKDSSDEDDSDPIEKPRRAPNELLMEFLDCLMKKEYKTAEKLCRMILIYEPDNPEAVSFHPIIKEKLELDQQEAADEDGGDAGGNDGDDNNEENGDNSESNEDSSLESRTSKDDSTDNSDRSDTEGDDGTTPPRPDSGIGLL